MKLNKFSQRVKHMKHVRQFYPKKSIFFDQNFLSEIKKVTSLSVPPMFYIIYAFRKTPREHFWGHELVIEAQEAFTKGKAHETCQKILSQKNWYFLTNMFCVSWIKMCLHFMCFTFYERFWSFLEFQRLIHALRNVPRVFLQWINTLEHQ